MKNKKKWASILTIATSLILCIVATFGVTLAFFGGNSTASLGTITLKTGVKVGASVTATDNTTKVVPGQQIEINATGTVEPYSSEGTVTSALLRVKFEVGGTMTVTPVFDTATGITLKTADGDKTGYWVNGGDGYYYLCSTTANATVGNTTLLRFVPVNTTTDSAKTKAVLAGDFQVPTNFTNTDSGKHLLVSATFEVIQGEIYAGTSSAPLADTEITIANTGVKETFAEISYINPQDYYQRITENGKDYILFGRYPQTIKASNVTITSDPVDENGYYTGSDGEKYAKQIANPYSTDTSKGEYALSNGSFLTKDQEYFFKVEPLKWRILKEENGQALIVSDLVLEHINYSYGKLEEVPEGTYSSEASVQQDLIKYKYSNIRWFLNKEFLNIAFTDMENRLINISEVDNSNASMGVNGSSSTYDTSTPSTYDKIFLLSVADVVNSEYGFNSDADTNDINRLWMASDYSKSKGSKLISIDNTAGFAGSATEIMTRSTIVAFVFPVVRSMGYGRPNVSVAHNGKGSVVPALNITL